MTWMQANATGCLDMDPRAHLAAITYENRAFISKQSEIFSTDFYWAGLQSTKPAWNFGTDYAVPVDDSIYWGSLSYPRPTHVGSPDMDCVYVNDFDGSWDDYSTCDKEKYSLCQLKQVRFNQSDVPAEWYSWHGRERRGPMSMFLHANYFNCWGDPGQIEKCMTPSHLRIRQYLVYGVVRGSEDGCANVFFFFSQSNGYRVIASGNFERARFTPFFGRS